MRYYDYLTTEHESKHLTETMSELYYIEEIPEEKFPLSFKITDYNQREEPILTKKIKYSEYIKGSVHGGWNPNNSSFCGTKYVPPD